MVAKCGDFTKPHLLKQSICIFVKKKTTRRKKKYTEWGARKAKLSSASIYISIVRFWLKIIILEENKYFKCIYNITMIQDI